MGGKVSTRGYVREESSGGSSLSMELCITKGTHLCPNCYFFEKDMKCLLNPVGMVDKSFANKEIIIRKKGVLKQHWEPCVKVLFYMGHTLSKVIVFLPKRCSHCGLFIFLSTKVYRCQTCGILCHSACVEKLRKICFEVRLLIKDKSLNCKVMGHDLEHKSFKFGRCSKCRNCVLMFFDTCVQCKDCGAIFHKGCVPLLDKNCPAVYLSQGYKVLHEEVSLFSQSFRCPDCNVQIFEEFQDSRFCYFSKKFYCMSCHHNKTAVIPQNVLQKWCFCPLPVSDWSWFYLNFMKSKPIIAIEDFSGQVTSFNGEFCHIRSLLEEMISYYYYLSECQTEFDAIFKWIRKGWPHLLQRPLYFSISALCEFFFNVKETKSYHLYPEILVCQQKLLHHLRNCSKCISQAQKCMACDTKGTETTAENAIYYFERTIISCKNQRCTPMNCVHRSCLKRNPFFICKGCDTQILKLEEFSSLGIKIVTKPASNSMKIVASRTVWTKQRQTVQDPKDSYEGECKPSLGALLRSIDNKRVGDLVKESESVGAYNGSLIRRRNIPSSGTASNKLDKKQDLSQTSRGLYLQLCQAETKQSETEDTFKIEKRSLFRPTTRKEEKMDAHILGDQMAKTQGKINSNNQQHVCQYKKKKKRPDSPEAEDSDTSEE